MPLRPGDPAALRDAHPERAGVRLDPRHADVRVPVEPAEAPQPQQPLGRDHAERVQGRVEPGHVVALRREVDVAVGVAPSRSSATFSSSKRRCTTTSSALKLEPRCPEPARLTATSAFSRHMSASARSRRSRIAPAARARARSSGLRDQAEHRSRSSRDASGRLSLRSPTSPAAPKTTSAGATGIANSMIEYIVERVEDDRRAARRHERRREQRPRRPLQIQSRRARAASQRSGGGKSLDERLNWRVSQRLPGVRRDERVELGRRSRVDLVERALGRRGREDERRERSATSRSP